MESKNELRKAVRAMKKTHTPDELRRMSAQIIRNVEDSPLFAQAKTVLLYHSLPDEVHTHDFIERWKGRKKIILPVVCGDDLELRTLGQGGLHTGAFDIQEPDGELFDDYAAIDIAIIPGMAFDNEGNRLGRGKGYYDRLLPKISCPKVGVCFPFQFVEHVPSEQHDIRMNRVIHQ